MNISFLSDTIFMLVGVYVNKVQTVLIIVAKTIQSHSVQLNERIQNGALTASQIYKEKEHPS